MKSSLVVEFIGLPGSGKSRISKELRRALKSKEIEVLVPTLDVNTRRKSSRFLFKMYNVISEIIFQPIVSYRYFIFILKTHQKTCLDFIKVFLNILFVKKLIRTVSRKKDVILLDQGLFQGLWSIAYSSRINSTKKLQNLPGSETPDIVVKVNGSPEIIKSRIKDREHKTSRLGLDLDKHSSFEKLEALLTQVENIIERQEKVDLISVNNNDEEDLENSIEKLSKILIKNELKAER